MGKNNTTKGTKKKTAPKKKAQEKVQVALSDLIFKKFQVWKPTELFAPAVVTPVPPDAPPFVSGADAQEVERIRALLFNKYDFTFDMEQAMAELNAMEKAEAERIALEKAEAERIAREKAEAERIAAEKAEAERIAREKAEAERIALEKAEAERIAREKAEAERIALEKAEAERIALEKAEAERIAREKAEAERIALEKAEAERIAREKAEAERIALEKAEAERIALEKAEAERIAREKAEAERIALEKAEAERIAREKAEAERIALEKAEAERIALEKAEAERIAREKAEAERIALEKAEAERIAREKVKVSYDQPDLPKDSDPMDKAIKIFAGLIVILIIAVIGFSHSNKQKYYLKPINNGIEIWQGSFSPKGKKILISLAGIKAPKEVKKVYSQNDVFPIIFNYYLNKADSLLDASKIPDFNRIKYFIEMAQPYAITKELRDLLTIRVNGMDQILLIHKADIAASKGGIDNLNAALTYLEKAKSLSVDPGNAELLNKRIQTITEMLKQLKTKAQTK